MYFSTCPSQSSSLDAVPFVQWFPSRPKLPAFPSPFASLSSSLSSFSPSPHSLFVPCSISSLLLPSLPSFLSCFHSPSHPPHLTLPHPASVSLPSSLSSLPLCLPTLISLTCSLSQVLQLVSSLGHLVNVLNHHPLHLHTTLHHTLLHHIIQRNLSCMWPALWKFVRPSHTNQVITKQQNVAYGLRAWDSLIIVK